MGPVARKGLNARSMQMHSDITATNSDRFVHLFFVKEKAVGFLSFIFRVCRKNLSGPIYKVYFQEIFSWRIGQQSSLLRAIHRRFDNNLNGVLIDHTFKRPTPVLATLFYLQSSHNGSKWQQLSLLRIQRRLRQLFIWIAKCWWYSMDAYFDSPCASDVHAWSCDLLQWNASRQERPTL